MVQPVERGEPDVLEHHPDIATIRCNLAYVMEAESKLDDALELYEKALKVRLRTYGAAHPHVADCHEGLALVKEAKGERDEALDKALKRKRYGRDLGDRIKKYDILGTPKDLSLIHI